MSQILVQVGPRSLTPGALARLASHDWPGNVRELRNVLCRAADATPHGAAIQAQDIDRAMRRQSTVRGPALTPREARALFERHSGNLSAAARTAGLPRTTFRKLLRA
jgi:transcriptional regulator of acetoin/glycerol metabolism